MNEIIMKENKWGFEVGDIVKYNGHEDELEFRGEFGGQLYAEHLIENGYGGTQDIIPTKHTGRYWTVMEYETWTLVRKANKPQREFRVGDKVKIISLQGRTSDPDEYCPKDYLGEVFFVRDVKDTHTALQDKEGMYVCCIWNYNLELVEDEAQVRSYIGELLGVMVNREYDAYRDKVFDITKVEDYYNNVESPTTIKKGQNIMSKLTNFVKDSFLSKEEKLMRKYGLKDSCGDYTSEARELAIQKLMSECDSYFIKVVKDMEAEEKANK